MKTNSMALKGHSIRPFIGAKEYTISRKFYNHLGFKEHIIASNMSYFYVEDFGFYLQDAYVKEWIDNTMLFYEVDQIENTLEHINSLKLTKCYKDVRVSKIVHQIWGKEFFLHDPSGILWHFGMFNSKS